ncbi:MAG: response regulator [Alphaproteobacteria bacterium]|nr:response regulator [Alphaproteobacteria bacterium]
MADRDEGPGEGDARIAQLEAELEAARRTIEVLMDRVERESRAAGPDQRAWLRTIGELQSTAEARRRALREREAFYRALFHHSPDAILGVDARGTVRTCNRTAEMTFGREPAELVGRPVGDLFEAESGAALTGLLWSGFAGVGDAELRTIGGRRLGFSVARLPDDDLLVVLRDITQRRRLEEALERTRREAGYGRLAAALAAELTAPLAVLLGRLQLLRHRPPTTPAQLRPVLDVLLEQGRQIDDVVTNLRALGRAGPPTPGRVLLADIVHRAIGIDAARLAQVRLEVDVPVELALRSDPDQAELAVRNLMLAAVSQMAPDRALRVRGELRDGKPVLCLEAEGLRLSDEVRGALAGQQPMDPGAGLGLGIAAMLIQDNGGRLQPSTGPDDVCLLEATWPAADRPGGGVGRHSVLVVDDDHLLCDTVSWMLSGRGLVVHTASSAEEALRLMTQRGFDCVLADLILPGMDGEALLAEVVRRWPEMQGCVVLTTGTSYVPDGELDLLAKPFTRAQLDEMVQGAIARKSR